MSRFRAMFVSFANFLVVYVFPTNRRSCSC